MDRSSAAATVAGALFLLMGGCGLLDWSDLGVGDAGDGSADVDRGGLDGSIDATVDGFVPTDSGARPDGRMVDAGDRPRDFHDVDWGPAQRLVLDGPSDCGYRHGDPVLTEDMRWLFVNRPEADCATRRFHVFEWRDGAPRWVGMIGPIVPSDTEHNGHLVSGARAGRPGDQLLLYTRGGGPVMTDRDLMAVWLRDDPPLTHETPFELAAFNDAMNQSGPNATLAGDRLVFVHDGDVYETTGSPPLGWGPRTQIPVAARVDRSEIDPSLSPDGRVLVWITTPPGGSRDIWVARRTNTSTPFTGARPLSQYNTVDPEYDAYIAPNGDLLFTRRVSGVYDVFLARAVFP